MKDRDHVDLPHPLTPKRTPSSVGGELAPLIERRCADAAWHFRVLLRTSWHPVPGPIPTPESDAPTEIGRYLREDVPARLTVAGAVADREIDPADWLDRSPLLAGRTVVSRRPFPTPSGLRGDVLATFTEAGQEHVSRALATRTGTRTFVLTLTTPRAHYDALADDFITHLRSFAPLHRKGSPFAEGMRAHGAETPVPWSLSFPASWAFLPGTKGDDVASFQAENARDGAVGRELVGKLSFAVLARKATESPRQVARLYLDAVREYDVDIEHDTFDDEKVRKPFERSWCLSTPVAREGVRGVLRCRLMRAGKVWALAGVLSPHPDDDAAAWMQNKRALDVATTTLKLTV